MLVVVAETTGVFVLLVTLLTPVHLLFHHFLLLRLLPLHLHLGLVCLPFPETLLRQGLLLLLLLLLRPLVLLRLALTLPVIRGLELAPRSEGSYSVVQWGVVQWGVVQWV